MVRGREKGQPETEAALEEYGSWAQVAKFHLFIWTSKSHDQMRDLIT